MYSSKSSLLSGSLMLKVYSLPITWHYASGGDYDKGLSQLFLPVLGWLIMQLDYRSPSSSFWISHKLINVLLLNDMLIVTKESPETHSTILLTSLPLLFVPEHQVSLQYHFSSA